MTEKLRKFCSPHSR